MQTSFAELQQCEGMFADNTINESEYMNGAPSGLNTNNVSPNVTVDNQIIDRSMRKVKEAATRPQTDASHQSEASVKEQDNAAPATAKGESDSK